jgi:hypothetical protein
MNETTSRNKKNAAMASSAEMAISVESNLKVRNEARIRPKVMTMGIPTNVNNPDRR